MLYQPLAPLIERCVFLSECLAKALVCRTIAPRVQGDVTGAIDAHVLEDLGADIVVTATEELGPGACFAIDVLELGGCLRVDVVFPNDAIHERFSNGCRKGGRTAASIRPCGRELGKTHAAALR